MKYIIERTTCSDQAFWIWPKEFLAVVDHIDLSCRDQANVLDAYHPEWFRVGDDQRSFFTPPAFYLKNGIARFINGRHRFVLLSRHLEQVPMALTNSDPSSDQVLRKIVARALPDEQIFDLPDLPWLHIS